MSFRLLSALTLFGAVAFAHAGDKKKLDHAPETAPAPREIPAAADIVSPAPPCQDAGPRQRFAAEPECPANAPSQQIDGLLPPPRRLRSSERMLLKTYTVADLVIPMPPAGKPAPEKPTTQERELIQNLRAAVMPDCWAGGGGPCTVEFFPIGLALVINAPAKVHTAVETYLDGLRQIQDTQFTVRLVIARVTDAGLERLGLARDFAPSGAKSGEVRSRIKFLPPGELPAFTRMGADCTSVSAPRITVLNGQEGCLSSGRLEHFLTGVNVQTVDGQVVFAPTNEPHQLGLELKVRPTLAGDPRMIKLAVAAQAHDLAVRPVEQIPLTTRIKPVHPNGAQGPEVPFTQFLQNPRFITRSVDETVVMPDGGTVVFYAGRATSEETVRERPAALADVPFLQELFARDKKVSCTDHLLVFATAQAVRPVDGDDNVRRASDDGKLPRLKAEYARACRDGDTEAARRLALECLVIDPTCFAR